MIEATSARMGAIWSPEIVNKMLDWKSPSAIHAEDGISPPDALRNLSKAAFSVERINE